MKVKNYFFSYHFFFKDGSFVSSKEKNRLIDITKFKNHIFSYLVTTSILERGVTIKDLQVIVFNASSPIFSSATLIQIAGRVGRKIGATDGEVYFLSKKITDSIKSSIEQIKYYNREKNNNDVK